MNGWRPHSRCTSGGGCVQSVALLSLLQLLDLSPCSTASSLPDSAVINDKHRTIVAMASSSTAVAQPVATTKAAIPSEETIARKVSPSSFAVELLLLVPRSVYIADAKLDGSLTTV